MVDYVTLTLKLTSERRNQIESLAHECGYDAPEDYLLALVDADSDDDPDDYIYESIRRGLREALNDEPGVPIDDLWAMLREK
jgi:hypothetical protein